MSNVNLDQKMNVADYDILPVKGTVPKIVHIKKTRNGRSVIDPVLTNVPNFDIDPNTDIKTPKKLKVAYDIPTVKPIDPSKRVKVGVFEPYFSDRCQQELDVYGQVHGLPPNKLIFHFWNPDAKPGDHDYVPETARTTHISMCIQAVYAVNPYAEIHVFNVPGLRLKYTLRALERAGELGIHMVTLSYGGGHNRNLKEDIVDPILKKYPNMLNFASIGNNGLVKDSIMNPSATRYFLSIGCSHLHFDKKTYKRVHEGASPGSSHGPCGPMTPKPEWQYDINECDRYKNKHCPDFVVFGNGLSIFAMEPVNRNGKITYNYNWGRGGATSLASPIACGLFSLVNQALLNDGKESLTLDDINRLLTNRSTTRKTFFDIEEIGRQPGWVKEGFRNLPNGDFDIVTGIGVPRVKEIIKFFQGTL
jgi:hypothetical protein